MGQNTLKRNEITAERVALAAGVRVEVDDLGCRHALSGVDFNPEYDLAAAMFAANCVDLFKKHGAVLSFNVNLSQWVVTYRVRRETVSVQAVSPELALCKAVLRLKGQ